MKAKTLFRSWNNLLLSLPLLLILAVFVAQVPSAHAVTYRISQDGITWDCVTPIATAETGAGYYDYRPSTLRGAIPDFGPEANKTFVWLHRDTRNGNISLGIVHNVIHTGGLGTFDLSLSGLPGTAVLTEKDDPLDVWSLTPPSGAFGWMWGDATDGAALDGLNGTWEITLTPSGVSGIDSWAFVNGPAEAGSEDIPLDLSKPLIVAADDQCEHLDILEAALAEYGIYEEIEGLRGWADDHDNIPLDLISLFSNTMIAMGLNYIDEDEGLAQILNLSATQLSFYLNLLFSLAQIVIDIYDLSMAFDHVVSDYESALATEARKVENLANVIEDYYANPELTSLQDVVEYAEDGQYGIYLDAHFNPSVFPIEFDKDPYTGLTWKEVFSYYRRGNGPYRRAEGWFSSGKEVDKMYARLIREVLLVKAEHALSQAYDSMGEYCCGGSVSSYWSSWLSVMEAFDYVSMAHVFKSMIYTQWAMDRVPVLGILLFDVTEHALYSKRRYDSVVLPYPKYLNRLQTKGYVYDDNEYVNKNKNWYDTQYLNMEKMGMAYGEAEAASSWEKKSREVLSEYLVPIAGN